VPRRFSECSSSRRICLTSLLWNEILDRAEEEALNRTPRILTQLPTRQTELVRRAYPEIEVIEIPSEGPLPEGIEGEILLTFPWGAPNLAETLERGVQWVHGYGTGVNGFPFDLLGDRRMTCSRGASARAISEWVIAVMLAAEKQLPQTWISEPPQPPKSWNVARLGTLREKKLGLIGFGGIAQAVARRALPFEMRVEALRRTSSESPIDEVEIVTTLEALLDDADHVVIAAPETPATRHLLDAKAFAMMKPGVHLVNIARGGLVDQDALRAALEAEQVGLASLDCVTPEPLPAGHWLYTHPRVRVSPHVSWSSPKSYAGLIEVFLENVGRYSRGEPLVGMVDPAEGY
jgi:phosphoglycerate dehydrogenase-like enzyme